MTLNPNGPFKLIAVVGARPNFMKLAPLLRAVHAEGLASPDASLTAVLVHTGQHFDENMSGKFFSDLGLPAPNYNLEVGPGSHAQQTAEIMKRFEGVVLKENPSAVIVVGDVNSTIACALVAAKLHVPVVHVEAGLRSFDRSMPEEINRVLTDAISDLLLLTESSGERNLLAEGIPPERIRLVGNLMIDSLRFNLERARGSDVMVRLGLDAKQRFGMLTLHRPANVDSIDQLTEIWDALREIAAKIPLLFPAHPRTRAHLQQLPADDRIRILEPLGYLDFLCLMSNSAVMLTDSGGIQEETTALGVPCLTLRNNTERPVTIEEGTNLLAGTTKSTILAAWQSFNASPKIGRVPKFWDGQAASRCLEAIRCYLRSQRA